MKALFLNQSELKEIEELFLKTCGVPVGYGLATAVFVKDKFALKVFSKAVSKDAVFNEAYILACVECAGIDSSRVYQVLNMHGYWVIEMSFVKGRSLLGVINDALIRGDREIVCRLIKEMAELQVKINSGHSAGLPKYKDYALEVLVKNPGISIVQKEKLKLHLESLPDGDCVCHGDLHPNNILYNEDGKMTAIDWAGVGTGVPACDAARTYVNLDMDHPAFIKGLGLDLQDIYLRAYCDASGVSPADIMRWTPIHAGMLVGSTNPDFSKLIDKFLL